MRTPVTVATVPALGPRTDDPGAGSAPYAPPRHRVLEFARLAARNGWDITALMPGPDAAAAWVNTPTSMASAAAMTRILDALSDATSDDLLGLGAAAVPRGTFRVLSFALSSAPSLGCALSELVEFQSSFPGLPRVSLTTAEDTATFAAHLTDMSQPADLVADAFLVLAHLTINWFIRRPLPLRSVDIPHPRPRGQSDYHLFFSGAELRFDTTLPALQFDSAALSAPAQRDRHEVDQLIRSGLTGLVGEFESCQSYAERVRQLIETSLGRTPIAATDIARSMRMSRQTLRRRLLEEHTSVTKIRDEVLRDCAIAGLSHEGQTAAAVAERLGFSEPSAFTRAFRRWTGVTPIIYRQG